MTENDTDPVLLRSVAERLATEAAEFVRRRRAEVFGDAATVSAGPAVRAKSTPTDPVTVVDTETERLLRDRLAELRPGEHILGEEEGGSTGGRDGLTWVLDPIDGTVNFIYGLETYAVSVGVQRDGASLAGAVANVPTGALYSAALGHGAHVRRAGVTTPLAASPAVELSMSLVGTGFSYAPEQPGTAGRDPHQAASRRARHATDRLVRARSVHGGRRTARRLLRGRRARLGLGGGRADRRGGGREPAAAAGRRGSRA